jgi:hypothetical protein
MNRYSELSLAGISLPGNERVNQRSACALVYRMQIATHASESSFSWLRLYEMPPAKFGKQLAEE